MANIPSRIVLVREIVMGLPDVEESTLHGAPSWKLRGKLLTCPAIHKSAEPNSLLVKVAPAERDELLAADPATYYTTDHYQRQPVVLARLSRVDRESLRALLEMAWRFVSEGGARKARRAR